MARSVKVEAIRQMSAEARAGNLCCKCYSQTPLQDSDEFLEWEAADSDGKRVVCPRCITPEEEQAILEDDAETMDAAYKVRENRVRRAAERQRCTLVKSRRRDANAWDYGTYMLVDSQTNGAILQNASLDDVQDWLDLPYTEAR